MFFLKELILMCSLTLILAEGYSLGKPLISASCEVNGISIRFIFKKPFGGTIFAQGYYSNPTCSSPNLQSINTTDVYLSLPLFACGTKLQKRKNRLPVIKNTIQIQYHPMMKTIYDTAMNVSCNYQLPLGPETWTLNRQTERKIPIILYRSWLNFKLGYDVMGDKKAKEKGVSYKLFLVAYVQDGGRNKDFKVGKCFAHDEHILTWNTTIFEMNPADNCSDSNSSSLSEFTVISPYHPVSDLMAYAEVKAFDIKSKGELFITCGMQLCESVCFRGCPEHYRHEINHWSTVSTHRLSKRSADEMNSAKLRNLENRNIFLKSTVLALSKKLLEIKTQQNARKNGSNFDRRVSKSLPQVESSILSDHNQDNETSAFTSTEESPLTEQSDHNHDNETIISTEESPFNEQSDATVTRIIDEEVAVINHTFNSSVSKTNFEEPLTVKADKQLTTTVALQNTTIFLPALYTDYFMTTGLPIYNRSTSSYEPSTVYIITSEDTLKLDKSSGNVSVELNAADTKEKLLINPGAVQDCVPNFKFLVVAIGLGTLSFSFFLICVGMWLYIRKERKRTALNSYLLYNFY